MSPPPWRTSPSTMSSTSSTGTPERFSASCTANFPRSNALKLISDPRRAVPIAVRAAETMTASPMVRLPCVARSRADGERTLTLPSGCSRRTKRSAVPDWGELQIDQLRFMARSYGDALAYRNLDAGTSLTFAEWDADSNRLARGLDAAGVQKGDRVSIYLPADEVLRWITAYAAVHKLGAVVVPTNTRLSVRELRTILGHAEVVAILTCESLVRSALDVGGGLPTVKLVISAGGAGGRVQSWDDVVHDDPSDFRVPVELTDLADVMYTSGTTGLPKGIAVRHSNVAMIPNNEPTWTGNGWQHGAPK